MSPMTMPQWTMDAAGNRGIPAVAPTPRIVALRAYSTIE